MPNKPVNHTNLDEAIKNSLLSTSSETKVTWEEIYSLLPKKSNVVKGPLANLSYSLNTFAGVISTGSISKLKSGLSFIQKGSVAMYIVLGTLVFSAGTYLIYHTSTKNATSIQENTVEIPALPEVINLEGIPPIEKDPITNSAHLSNSQETTTSSSSIDSKSNSNISSEVHVSENPDPNGEPLLNTATQNEKAPVEIEPIQLKTVESVPSEGYDFSTKSDNTKTDTAVEVTTQTNEPKKAKVLYYKESLTLDKLEQQLSDDNNTKKTNPPFENNTTGGTGER